jgi:hypothetical protein
MIQRHIHADLEQPRPESTGRVKEFQLSVCSQKDFLRQIFDHYRVENETRDDSYEPAFVTAYKFSERFVAAFASHLDEASVIESLAVAFICVGFSCGDRFCNR